MAMSHVCRIESSQFDAAAQHFSTSDCESMTPEQRAKLTGLFNQATKGDCKGNRPSQHDVKGRMEFDYWALVLGMSSDDAKYAYVKLLKEVDPSFDVNRIKFPKSPKQTHSSSNMNNSENINSENTNIVTNIYDVMHPASEASSSSISSPNNVKRYSEETIESSSNDFWKYQTHLVEETFELAVKHASTPSCKNASNEQKAKLYGCFKQANKGDCTGSRPGVFDQIGRFKYDAWNVLKGHTRNDACIAYVETVMEIDPMWTPRTIQSSETIRTKSSQKEELNLHTKSKSSLRPIAKPPKRSATTTVSSSSSDHPSDQRKDQKPQSHSRSKSPSKKGIITEENHSKSSNERKTKSSTQSIRSSQRSNHNNNEEEEQDRTSSQSNKHKIRNDEIPLYEETQVISLIGLSFTEFFFLNIAFLAILAIQCFYFQSIEKRSIYFKSQFISSIFLNISFMIMIYYWILRFKQLSYTEKKQKKLSMIKKKSFIQNQHQNDIYQEKSTSISSSSSSPHVPPSFITKPIMNMDELISLFQGTWLKDLNRSDSQNEHMAAIGVPWLIRAAINRSSQETEISTDGKIWIETTTNLGGRKVQTLQLDGSLQERRNPLDLSPVTMTSSFRSDGCVVTESEYLAMGIKQVLTRRVHRCEDISNNRIETVHRKNEGAHAAEDTCNSLSSQCRRDVYHVTNVMTLKDGTVLVAHSYFDRIEGN